MGFLDFFLGPQCADCGIRITSDHKREWKGKVVCEACLNKHLEIHRHKEREAEERAQAQADARARLEGRKEFGSDPRND